MLEGSLILILWYLLVLIFLFLIGTGSNIFREDFKLTLLSISGGFVATDYLILLMYYAYHHRDNVFAALQVLASVGAIVPVI